MANIFELLMEYGSPKLAIRYAKRIIKEGQGKIADRDSTGNESYELVEELAKYLPEEYRKLFS